MKAIIPDFNSTQRNILTEMHQVIAQNDNSLAALSGENFGQLSPLSFSHVFKQAIENVDAIQQNATELVKAVDSDSSDDLAGAMIASQKADIAFSALLQTRNKLSSALDEVMNIAL